MNDADDRPAIPLPALLIGVFLVSAATLHLEIVQTRVFALVLWHHVTYLVVTFTLLGFAASGTLLSVFPEAVERNPRRFLGICALLFGLTSLGAFAFLARHRIDTFALLERREQYLWVFAYYLYLVVPFVLAGLAIGGALKIAGRRTGLVYGVNLAGSAIGCLLFVLALRPLGGAGSVLLASATALLGAVAFGGTATKVVGGIAAAGMLAAIGFGERVLPFEAAPGKPLVEHLRMENARRPSEPPAYVEASRWDPICRVDVVNFGSDEAPKRVFQDGDAPTEILPAAAKFDPSSCYHLPYFVHEAGRIARGEGSPPEVLAIGIGGGMDLLHALWGKASKVTGVEINASTDELMRGPFAEFSGHVYTRPGVDMVVGEGRSFVRRSREKYDVIQMTGTDTFTALASGSYVLSESYLYTVDAFRDYFDHLKPGGYVSTLRFRFLPPRESLRLVAIAIEALRERGVEHPERNVLIVDQIWWHLLGIMQQAGESQPLSYSSMLFKATPFEPAEIAAVKTWVDAHPQNAGRPPDRRTFTLGYAPGEPITTEFGEYLDAVARGTDAEYAARYPVRIDPVSDDSPYFFNYHRWSSLLEPAAKTTYLSMTGRDPIGLFLLLTALGESLLLVVLLVVLPLLLSRRTLLPRERRGPVLVHFLGLGLGYLFLEIAAMQRFVLYLGHPTRSITVVLFSFLLFSGLGAAVAGKLRLTSARLPLLLVVASAIACALWQPALLDATLGLETPVRIAIAVGVLALPAFLMGMPFPVALSKLTGESKPFLPWALAINGGASVVASIVAILVAMEGGFTAVFACAAASYALAWWTAGRLPRPATS
jgi:hypothetical protein